MKLHMSVYLHVKFEVSSIILASFRRGREGGGVILTPPPPPPQNEPLKIPPRLELKLLNRHEKINKIRHNS